MSTLKISMVALSLLFSSSAMAGYDQSTVSQNFTSPQKEKPHIKNIDFPYIETTTVYEGLQEAKDYAEATSQRFVYKIEDLSAKMKGPFNFQGGSLFDLSKYLDTLNLFTEIKRDNLIVVSTKKHFYIPTRGKNTKDIKKHLNNIKGISKVRTNNKVISFVASKDSYKSALKSIEKVNTPVKNKNTNKVKTTPPVSNGNGYSNSTVVVIKGGGIGLDKPYTVKTFLRELGNSNGKIYDVYADTNIPVNKNVKINGVEDLNTYLRKTTGVKLKTKKTKSGLIIVE